MSKFNQTHNGVSKIDSERDFGGRGFQKQYIKSVCRPRKTEDRFDVDSDDSYEHQRPNKLAQELESQMIRSMSNESIKKSRK